MTPEHLQALGTQECGHIATLQSLRVHERRHLTTSFKSLRFEFL